MISEPEMSDEQGGEPPGDLLSDADDRDTATAAARKPRPWLWAVGGIAVASAVWATVMYGGGATAPDLHGYHLGGNVCGSGALSPLKDAVGVRDFAVSEATVSSGPALDKLSCVLSAAPPFRDGWVTSYTVSVSVELHKKTDPRAEFENTGHVRLSTLPGAGAGNQMIAVAETGLVSGADVHPVTGVGDEAYLLAPRASDQSLEVLNGGAVLVLQVSGFSQWNGSDESRTNSGDPPEGPDLSRLRPAMTVAMRHLMASMAS